MANKFSELRKKMTPKAKAESKRLVEKAIAEMPLNELRNAKGLSQKMLAEALNIQQPAIAKLEKRTDMYISTLRSHIEGLIKDK